MGFRVRVLRQLLAVLMLTGVSVLAWSMFVVTLPEREATQAASPARRLIAERVKHLESTAKGRRGSGFGEEFDLNYVSRRRIPCGPDPIHNRRFVRLRVPPARH
uniref:Uncharacterized protein n=1 Tax=Kalanchoe fedtschenkoi TaxID=63787 RepID=A0A7N0V272_KALFE